MAKKRKPTEVYDITLPTGSGENYESISISVTITPNSDAVIIDGITCPIEFESLSCAAKSLRHLAKELEQLR
jgi:hypothetical protein